MSIKHSELVSFLNNNDVGEIHAFDNVTNQERPIHMLDLSFLESENIIELNAAYNAEMRLLILKDLRRNTMSDLNARCLILASNAFLTENLTEEVLALDDDLIYAFIEENKSEMVQDYSPEQIWGMVDDHAQRLKVFIEAKLSKANEEQASNALKEIEDALSELENVAENLITKSPTNESAQRGQGIYHATNRLRFLIKNIRRCEGL